jgi:hypothetical protein
VGTELATSDKALSGGMALGQWYTLRLIRRGASLTAEVYIGRVDPASGTPELSVGATDGSLGAFTQINVNGGRDFDTDDVSVVTR